MGQACQRGRNQGELEYGLRLQQRVLQVKAVYTDLHRSHDPQFFLVRGVVKRTTEQPERAEAFGKFLIEETIKWGGIIRASGATAN